MKKLLFGLLFICNIAYAESWFIANEGGGEIVITSQVCKADGGKYPELRHAYSWTGQLYQEGCWYLIDGNIHIVWVHNDNTRARRVYPIDAFTKKETY